MIKDRLKAYLTHKHLTARAFERLCGLGNGVLSKLSRTTSPTTLQKIESNSDLNLEWLFTGKGEMLKDIPLASNIKPSHNNSDISSLVPLVPAAAFAGMINGLAPESISPEQCELIASPVAGAEMAIPITGDSMEPEYHDGAIAYIRRINEVAFIPWGHTVILDTENGAFIKRIYPDENNEDYVWAKSINQAYPPMHIPKASIFRIFRVLGTARIFTTM